MPKMIQFQLLKRDDLMLFFVMHDIKWNVLGFFELSVAQNKQSEDVTLGSVT